MQAAERARYLAAKQEAAQTLPVPEKMSRRTKRARPEMQAAQTNCAKAGGTCTGTGTGTGTGTVVGRKDTRTTRRTMTAAAR